MTTQSDPLAIYRIGKMGAPKALQQTNPFEESQESDLLAEYRTKKMEDTNYSLKDVPRVAGGLAARSGEIVAGSLGNLQKGFGSLLDLTLGNLSEKVTGKKQPEFREFLRNPLSTLGKYAKDIEDIEKQSLAPGERSTFAQLPTSEDIRENITKPASEHFTGEPEYLEPKNEYERFAQEFTQDLTALALPGSGVQSWMGRIGLSLAGNTAKETAKQMGFSPSTQELAKIGTLGIVSLAQIGNAPKFARDYFQQSKSMIPKGVRFNSQPLQAALHQVKNTQWFRGHSTPSTMAAREMIEAIEKRIQRGSINAHDAMTLRENINELAKNLGAFKVEGTQRTAHVGHLNEVRDALMEGMEQTIGKQYPSWWNTYQDANAVFGITQRSSALGNFIANNYAKPVISDAGKILFGNALARGTAGVAKLGIAGAGIASGAKVVELTNRMARSKTLRKYYAEVVKSAAKGDSIAMSEALNKFDEYALKEEKEKKALKPIIHRNQK